MQGDSPRHGASRAPAGQHRLTAVLGPTNTGKTHFAMERMLAHESGMIGFPLRLLARENFDRAVHIKGPHAVALVTGEEKIMPPYARYFLCTAEAMPLERAVDFLAIDEAQLAADADRGHIFTDRLLRARGRIETIVIGSETLRPLLRRILPEAEPVNRPRFSRLSYAGRKKVTRLPPRSAVIGFSAADVYALAELMRRRRGGTAVVLGALSPRTRNAQVELYQSGDVDYVVATDAIGMGLNMDIDHVAFARLSKFDGHSTRRLTPAELGQIAGRAGRHMNDGTFGTTAGEQMSPELIAAVEEHRFDALRFLYWRNPELDTSSVERLLESLGVPPDNPAFVPARAAEDATTLAMLAMLPEIRRLTSTAAQTKLLWEVCQIPDFRKTMPEAHARLVARLYLDLAGGKGRIGSDWMARQVERIDRVEGEIGTLVGRIAEIRTWTYVSYRNDWIEEARHWQERTRAVEDKLSDALHERLTDRFVDKRTAALLRRLRARDELIGGVRDDGEVVVEGIEVGRLEGFRFVAAPRVSSDDAETIRQAADRALRPTLLERVTALEASADEALALGSDGSLLWRGVSIGNLARGGHPLRPAIRIVAAANLDAPLRERISVRSRRWLERHIEDCYGALIDPRRDLGGAARGLMFQLSEALGALPAAQVRELIAALTARDRKLLARLGVRLGTESVFMPRLAASSVMPISAMLWAVFNGREPKDLPPHPKTPTAWFRADENWPDGFYRALGYRRAGAIAIRADRLEALAAAARRLGRQGAFAATPALARDAGLPARVLKPALESLGYGFTPEAAGGLFRLRRGAPQRRGRAHAVPDNPVLPFAQLRQLKTR